MRARASAVGLAALFLSGCLVVEGRIGPPGPPIRVPAARVARVGPPPILVAPALVVIAGTSVAYADDWPGDLFVVGGHYYQRHGGRWYSAPEVGRDWREVPAGRVPRAITGLPPDYRRMPRAAR